jgi:hypothetical protein
VFERPDLLPLDARYRRHHELRDTSTALDDEAAPRLMSATTKPR